MGVSRQTNLKVHLLVDSEGGLGLVVVEDAHELRFLRKGMVRSVYMVILIQINISVSTYRDWCVQSGLEAVG